MSFKLKLAISFACSFVLISALCWFFLGGRDRPASREAPAAARKESPGKTRPAAAKKRKKARTPAAPPVKEPAPPAAEPAAERGWRIAGRVVREDGSRPGTVGPVEGALVRLSSPPRSSSEAAGPVRDLRTGPDGRFEIDRVSGKRRMRLDIDAPPSAYRRLGFQLGELQGSGSRDLGDVLLEPASTLTVRLIGPGGEPAAGGRVLSGRKAPPGSTFLAYLGLAEARLEAVEKDPGVYLLERAPPGRQTLHAAAPGCAERRAEVNLPRKSPLVLRLAEGGRISGRVLGAAAEGVAKARLEVLDGPGARELAPRAETDATGRFLFDALLEGEYVIGVEADGFADTRLRSIASGTEGLEVVLEAAAILAGKVVAGSEEDPVAGVELVLRDREGVTWTESSDELGRFRFHGLRGGVHELVASHPLFAPARETALELSAGARVVDHVIRLEAGFTAAGTVADAESGEPIGDAEVTLAGKGGSAPTRTARSDATGAFKVKGLPAGKYEVRAIARGFLRSKQPALELPDGGVKDLGIALERGGSISGRVLDDRGKPLSSALVQPSMAFTTDAEWNAASESIAGIGVETDAEGRYRLEGLPPHGAYLIQASAGGFAPVRSTRIQVGRKQDVTSVDLVLRPGGGIRGRITDSDGKPIPGATLQAEAAAESEEHRVYTALDAIGKEALTDAAGEYALSPLGPGLYEVKASAGGYIPAARAGVEVGAGGAAEGVDFILEKGRTLAGTVVDADGSGIAGAEVVVEGEGRARTGAGGRFSVKGLRGGGATVRAQKRGYAAAELEIEDARREITIQMQRLARITGRLEAAGRDSFPAFQVLAVSEEVRSDGSAFRQASRTDPSGRFEVEVEAGAHVLQAMVPGFAPTRSDPVTVEAGATLEDVVIALVSGGTVRGVVVARGTGEPIQGARIAARGNETAPWEGYAPAASKTDADGAFTLEGVPERFTVTASHKEHARATVPGLTVPPGGSIDIRVEMGGGGGIRGTLTRGGSPLAGIPVKAERQGASEPLEKRAVTDGRGRFELARMSAGPWVLTMALPGSPPLQRLVTVRDGETTDLDEVAVGAGVRLHGRVTSGGAPVSGGSITATQGMDSRTAGARAAIDGEGGYSVELPGPGTYRLAIEAGNQVLSGSSMEVTVTEGALDQRLDIEVPTGGLSGVVSDARSGEPIPGAQVHAIRAGKGAPGPSGFADLAGQARTDPRGRFHIALEPGLYSLRAAAEGRAEGGIDGLEVGGRVAVAEISIALEPGVGLAVWVVDERGQPVAGAAAFLRAEGGAVLGGLEPPRSREDGYVELTGLRQGPCRVTVFHPAFPPSTAAVEAGSGAEPTLVLRAGGRLSVTVATADGEPVAGARIELKGPRSAELLDGLRLEALLGGSARRETDGRGALDLERVPPGAYQVAASRDGTRSREERIVIRAGQPALVRLTLEAAGR